MSVKQSVPTFRNGTVPWFTVSAAARCGAVRCTCVTETERCFFHTRPVRTRTGVTDASVHHAGSVEIGKKLRKYARKQAPQPQGHFAQARPHSVGVYCKCYLASRRSSCKALTRTRPWRRLCTDGRLAKHVPRRGRRTIATTLTLPTNFRLCPCLSPSESLPSTRTPWSSHHDQLIRPRGLISAFLTVPRERPWWSGRPVLDGEGELRRLQGESNFI